MPESSTAAFEALIRTARSAFVLAFVCLFAMLCALMLCLNVWSWATFGVAILVTFASGAADEFVRHRHFREVAASFAKGSNLSRRDLDILVAHLSRYRDMAIISLFSSFAAFGFFTGLALALSHNDWKLAGAPVGLALGSGILFAIFFYTRVVRASRALIESVTHTIPVHRLRAITHTVSRLGNAERSAIAVTSLSSAPILSLGLTLVSANDFSSLGTKFYFALLGIGVLTFASYVALDAMKLLIGPLGALAQRANELAERTVRRQTFVAVEDELWELSLSTLLSTQIVSEVVRELDKTTQTLNQSATHMRGLTKTSVEKGKQQTAAVVEISAAGEQLTHVASNMVLTAQNVTRIAEETLNSAERSKESAQTFVDSVNVIEKTSEQVMSRVNYLSRQVNQIGKITEFIQTLGDKTEVLALNAELEAHRAGQSGDGFSLVALEMRRVAETVTKSTREIDSLLAEIREATRNVEGTSQNELRSVRSGVSASSQLNNAVSHIVGLAKNNATAVMAVSASSEEQRISFGHLRQALSEVTMSAQASSAVSQDLDTASEKLVALADQLRGVVQSFRIE